MNTVKDIRRVFQNRYRFGFFAENNTVEIINASFIADEETIFGEMNIDYANREIAWYLSMNRNISGIEGKIPEIWKQVADKDGLINSNYGWCILSEENYSQYKNCIQHLVKDKYTRQAAMIYIRPNIHEDAFANGMKDFICTYSAQILIRNNKLEYIVYMRSNDAVFGYKNDKFWHSYVRNMALQELQKTYPDLQMGNLYWNAASLHVYPRHYKYLEI